jgi:hypothetical protein
MCTVQALCDDGRTDGQIYFAAGVDIVTVDMLGPRDLSACPQYTFSTDNLSASNLDALPSAIFAQATANDTPVAALVDTGADTTLLHAAILASLPSSDHIALTPFAYAPHVTGGHMYVQLANLNDVALDVADHAELALVSPDFDVLQADGPDLDPATAPHFAGAPTEPASCLRADSLLLPPSAFIGTVTATDRALADAATPPRSTTFLTQLDMSASVFAVGSPDHERFVSVLDEFEDRFALHADDYGRTTLLQHDIETDPDAPPPDSDDDADLDEVPRATDALPDAAPDERAEPDELGLHSMRDAAPMSADDLLADADRADEPVAPLENRDQEQAAPVLIRAPRAKRLPPRPRVRLPRACNNRAPPVAPTLNGPAGEDAHEPEPPDKPPRDEPDAAALLPAILQQRRGPDGPTRSYTDAATRTLRALSAFDIELPQERVVSALSRPRPARSRLFFADGRAQLARRARVHRLTHVASTFAPCPLAPFKRAPTPSRLRMRPIYARAYSPRTATVLRQRACFAPAATKRAKPIVPAPNQTSVFAPDGRPTQTQRRAHSCRPAIEQLRAQPTNPIIRAAPIRSCCGRTTRLCDIRDKRPDLQRKEHSERYVRSCASLPSPSSRASASTSIRNEWPTAPCAC